MTLTTTEIMQSIKLVFFGANDNPQPAAPIQLSSMNKNGEQMRSVSINEANPKGIPESDLLKSENYKILSDYQDPANIGILQNGCACLQKHNRVEKAMSEEKERNKKCSRDARRYRNV
jgi:hypothetical protein